MLHRERFRRNEAIQYCEIVIHHGIRECSHDRRIPIIHRADRLLVAVHHECREVFKEIAFAIAGSGNILHYLGKSFAILRVRVFERYTTINNSLENIVLFTLIKEPLLRLWCLRAINTFLELEATVIIRLIEHREVVVLRPEVVFLCNIVFIA